MAPAEIYRPGEKDPKILEEGKKFRMWDKDGFIKATITGEKEGFRLTGGRRDEKYKPGEIALLEDYLVIAK